MRVTAVVGLLLLRASAVFRCPVCHSAVGRELRARLFDGHFLHTLLIVALPCPVLLVAVLLVYFAMPDLAEPGLDAVRDTVQDAGQDAGRSSLTTGRVQLTGEAVS